MTPAEERELETLDMLIPTLSLLGMVDSKGVARWLSLGTKKATEKTDEVLAKQREIAQAEDKKRWARYLETYDPQPKEKKLTIQSSAQATNPAPLKFPRLMIEKELGFIVLMTEERVGVVVHSTISAPSKTVGYGSSDWAMRSFVPFHGTVTLAA